MPKVLQNCKGSLTLEATIVFPIFLALLLLIINFIKVALVYVAMDHAVSETTKQIATQSYPLKYLYTDRKLDFLEGVQAELLTKILQGEAIEKLVREKIIQLYPLGKLKNEDFRIAQLKLYHPSPSQGQPVLINNQPLNQEDVLIRVEYQVMLRVPFFPARELTLSNTALERAWVDDL